MNHLDQSLQRLFKTAAQAPQESAPALPFALEARTLARWRSAAADEEAAFLARLFRRAVICASTIMLLSIGWSRIDGQEPTAADASVLAHYEIAMQVLP